jgi:hypothetical protein
MDFFEDRLREAVVDPQDVPVESLRAAIRPTGAKAKLPLILDLVRMAHRRQVQDDASTAFRKAVNAKEPLVPAAGSEQLMSILALSCLIEAFSGTGAVARPVTAAALSVRAVSAAGWAAAHPDLPNYARRCVDVAATRTRENPASWTAPRFADLADGSTETLDPNDPAHAFALLATEREITQGNFESLRKVIEGFSAGVLFQQHVSKEQQDVVWWLLTAPEPSSTQSQAVNAGVTFAESSRFIPGPLATDQLLRHRLGNIHNDDVPTDSLVGLWPRAPIINVSAVDGYNDLMPILMALHGSPPPTLVATLTAGAVARSIVDEMLLLRLLKIERIV